MLTMSNEQSVTEISTFSKKKKMLMVLAKVATMMLQCCWLLTMFCLLDLCSVHNLILNFFLGST